MKWIDSHLHIGYDKDGSKVGLSEIRNLFKKDFIDKALAFCFDEENGINRGNKKIKEAIKEENKIKGMFRVDPKKHSPEDLRELNSFSGFKLHPHSQNFKLKNIPEYLNVLEEINKPVLIHIGQWGENPHPEEVLKIAEKLQELKIIFAHSIRGYYFKAKKEFIKKFKRNKNIYVDLSFQASHSAIEVLVNDLGADRLLFASDYPYGHPEPVKKSIKHADIKKEEKEKIAYKNAKKIFW